jgi:hypothetical protein
MSGERLLEWSYDPGFKAGALSVLELWLTWGFCGFLAEV